MNVLDLSKLNDHQELLKKIALDVKKNKPKEQVKGA